MKVKYGQNTIIDDDEKTSVTLRTQKKMLDYDLQIQASSGSDTPVQEIDVEFFDYDGTLVYAYPASTFLAMDAMPECPVHEGLISQGWNFTLAEAKEVVSSIGLLFVGHSCLYEDDSVVSTDYDVKFFDKDGTLVYHYSKDDFLELQAMPSVPVHAGLTSLGWNYTFEEARTAVTNNTFVNIGALYKTDDDWNRFYIKLENINQLGIRIYYQSATGGSEIYWGDGSSETTTATSTVRISHTYASIGEYVIRIKPIRNDVKISVYSTKTQLSSFIDYIDTYSGTENSDALGLLTKIELSPNTITLSSNAFGSCFNLKEAIGLPVYPQYGFYRTGLEYVCLEKNIPAGNYCFSDCKKIKNISIGQGVQYVPYMFMNCNLLEEVIIPSSVTSMGSAFSNCYSLSKTVFHKGLATVTGFSSCRNLTYITIPSSVTKIDSSAFQSCIALSKVVMHQGLQYIESNAFYGCSSLETLLIPNTVISIKDYGISTSALRTICIPKTNTPITFGQYQLQYDYYIEYVLFPKEITTTVSQMLWSQNQRSSLKRIFVPSHTKDYTLAQLDSSATRDLKVAVYSIDSTQYVFSPNYAKRYASLVGGGGGAYTEKIYINYSKNYQLTSLSGYSNNYSLREFKMINNYLTSIGNNCFQGCYNLQILDLPFERITSIGSNAFNNCYQLREVEFENVTSIGTNAFNNCRNLKKAIFPKLKDISSNAFSACYILKDIVFDSELTNIGDGAFSYCHQLSSFTIPSTILTLGQSVFSSCYNLKTLIINAELTTIPISMCSSCYSLESINIPSTVTSIGNSAFSNCTNLHSIGLPNNLTSIGTSAFYQCQHLESINIPSTVTSIGNSAFSYCQNLTSLNLPSGLTSIPQTMCSNCYYLESVTIPSTVTSIGNSAFSSCYSLKSIELFSGITSIEPSAFAQCYNLESINIPSTVTSIGTQAFYGCYSLISINLSPSMTELKSALFRESAIRSIEIPSSIVTIEAQVFQNCTSLKTIKFDSSTPPTVASSNAFSGLYSLTTIYVPTGSLSAYTTATNYPSASTYTYVEYDPE